MTGVVTTPLDVVKTRLMTQGTSGRYAGTLDCISTIWRQEGASAFLKVVCIYEGDWTDFLVLMWPGCRAGNHG